MIPLVITAKNEEKAIAQCLHSLLVSTENIHKQAPYRIQLWVVLDDCSDKTETLVKRFPEVSILTSSGGIVEAQRKAFHSIPADFIIFSDADIHVETQALKGVIDSMIDDPSLRVAYPLKAPLPPQKSSLIAQALYTYNRVNGFQTKRHYFNGRLFAIRQWFIPTAQHLHQEIKTLANCRFYQYEEGIRTDDIYLSRSILSTFGRSAIKEVQTGQIYYRPPATYQGMYRTYRRMRMEIERLHKLLPESETTHKHSGQRTYDKTALRKASSTDKSYWYVFRIALQVCKLHYLLEKIWYQHFARRTCPSWEIIEESKHPIFNGSSPLE